MNTSNGIAIRSILFNRELIATKIKVNNDVKRRRSALRTVDRQLAKGNYKLAVSLVKQLQRQPPPAGLSGFASAKQVPRRVSSVEELHLNVTETYAIQPLFDSILDSINSSLRSSSQEVPRRVSSVEELHLNVTETYAIQPLFDSILDSINSSLRSSSQEVSVIGEDSDLYLEDDRIEHKQVLQHEAGHFLVGYLLGVLPKQYKFSSMEDVNQDETIDASVKFVGFDFLTELEDVVLLKKNLDEVKPGHRANKHKLSSTVLGKFACVIVGGLVAEHLVYGYSKGHHADVEKLDRVLRWLQFPEDEASTLMRWAVLNTLLILRRHGEARSTLVEAMVRGRSIGSCIDVIESSLNHQDI